MEEEKLYYRPKEAAKYLGIGLSTLFLYFKEGKIQKQKIGTKITVVSKRELERFVQENI